ncbi:MAG: hypothetical protein JNL05_11225 [Flavobacteriales bacterium]|nr:hypothetical protein [Flavobacteriales bacterium]
MGTGDCREDWNAMPPAAGGRFCGKCQHAVMDFTGWDRAAVLAYKRAHPEACGLYRAEHIEPDLVPLVDLLRPRRGLLAAGLALGAITVTAQAPADPAPTEQRAPDGTRITKPERTGDHALRPVSEPGYQEVCPRPDPPPVAKAKPHRFRRMYVSKRFPFIHFRRPRIMGRYALHTHDNMLRVTGTPGF